MLSDTTEGITAQIREEIDHLGICACVLQRLFLKNMNTQTKVDIPKDQVEEFCSEIQAKIGELRILVHVLKNKE